MAFNLLNKDIETLTCPALVVFSKASSQKDKAAKVTHTELHKKLAASVEEKAISGKHQEVVTFRELGYKGFRHVIVVGLGKENKIDHESVRQSMASAFEAIKAVGAKEAAIHFDGITTSKKDAADFAKATVEGLILTSYVFNELMSGKKEEKDNSNKQIGLFAVFDGHSGSTASQYMKKELQTRITNMTNPLNHKELQETIVKMDVWIIDYRYTIENYFISSISFLFILSLN